MPFFDRWALEKDAQRARNGLPPWEQREKHANKKSFPAFKKAAEDDLASQLAAVSLELEQLKALNVKKKVLLDSGANHSVISHMSHVDTKTIPCRRADKSSGVETADGTVMPISGDGIIQGCDGVFCENASHSLVSQSQWAATNDGIVIADATHAFGVSSSHVVLNDIINGFKNNSYNSNEPPLLTAHVNHDHLNEITSSHVTVHNDIPPSLPGALEYTTAEDTSSETANWMPDEATLERHELAVEAYTFGSYYFTAECQTLRDLVRFFHEAWDHPSKD